MVAARFIKRIEVTQTFHGPELAAAFEAALLLATGRLDCSRANRPALVCKFLVVHAAGMSLKIVLLPPDRCPGFSRPFLYPGHLLQGLFFPAVPQVVQHRFDPPPQTPGTLRRGARPKFHTCSLA